MNSLQAVCEILFYFSTISLLESIRHPSIANVRKKIQT